MGKSGAEFKEKLLKAVDKAKDADEATLAAVKVGFPCQVKLLEG